MQTAQDVLNCDQTIGRQSMSRVQLRKVLKTTLTLPTLSSRWEKLGRGGTEDETVKLLDEIQRV
jgi:hypothetical protein